MTLETPLRPEPINDRRVHPELELADLFRKTSPAVKVMVRKRRLPAAVDGATGSHSPGVTDDGMEPPAGETDRQSRVHRISMSAGQGQAGREGEPDGDVTPLAPLPATLQRRRRAADPLRRPGEVRILVQAPAATASLPDDAPMWQRLLCVPAPGVSYDQVLRALGDLQLTVAQLRRAAATGIF